MGSLPSNSPPVLPHPPQALQGVERVPLISWEAMQATLPMPRGQGRHPLLGTIPPAAIDDHDHFVRGGAVGRHDVMDRLAHLLGITLGHELREDVGGPRLDCAHNTGLHAAGALAPDGRTQPHVALAVLVAYALAGAAGTQGVAHARRGAPPTCSGQRQAPEDRCVCTAHEARTAAGPGLQGGAGAGARGAGRRGRFQSARRTRGVSRVFPIPTVSLDVNSLATSSCGYYRDQIEPRDAH